MGWGKVQEGGDRRGGVIPCACTGVDGAAHQLLPLLDVVATDVQHLEEGEEGCCVSHGGEGVPGQVQLLQGLQERQPLQGLKAAVLHGQDLQRGCGGVGAGEQASTMCWHSPASKAAGSGCHTL